MRVKATNKDLQIIFKTLAAAGIKQKTIALKEKVSVKTIQDWRSGLFTMPLDVFKRLIIASGLDKEKISYKLLPEYWNIKNASKKGALVRMSKYGNFGTKKGRAKGGLNSIKSHIENKTPFKTIKKVPFPKHSEKLAELLGIFFGDGHLSKYQASVTTNSKTDIDHAKFTKKLMEKLFRTTATLKTRKKEKAVRVTMSSKMVVTLLNKLGMPIGNKIKKNLSIPNWIKSKVAYKEAFIRGIFDTDGCVYFDKHNVKNKKYGYIGWTITSYAVILLTDIIKTLKELGFSPTNTKSQKSVFMRKQQEIEQYFKIIGTNNKKHYNRFKEFKMEGRVRRMVRHQSRKLEPRKGFVGSSPTPSARWI